MQGHLQAKRGLACTGPAADNDHLPGADRAAPIQRGEAGLDAAVCLVVLLHEPLACDLCNGHAAAINAVLCENVREGCRQAAHVIDTLSGFGDLQADSGGFAALGGIPDSGDKFAVTADIGKRCSAYCGSLAVLHEHIVILCEVPACGVHGFYLGKCGGAGTVRKVAFA